MTAKEVNAHRSGLLSNAADEVKAIIDRVEAEYGPTFRRNGGHLAILEQAKERLKRKPGRKPKASEVAT